MDRESRAADERFADELIERLNALIKSDDSIPWLLGAMFGNLTVIFDPDRSLLDHPTIQAWGPGEHEGIGNGNTGVTPLGLLNGLVGTIQAGGRQGAGYVAAVRELDGRVSSFQRSDQPSPAKESQH
jgi:hypothetical protein